jgi:hypothetical protein
VLVSLCLVPGRGHTRLRKRGWGVPIRTRGQALWYSRYIRMYDCTYFVMENYRRLCKHRLRYASGFLEELLELENKSSSGSTKLFSQVPYRYGGKKREATSVFDSHWIRIQSGQQQNPHNEIQSTSKKLKDEKWRWRYGTSTSISK